MATDAKTTAATQDRATQSGDVSGAMADSEILARLDRLEAAEKEIERLRLENERLAAEQTSSLAGLRLRHEAKPFAPEGGSYRFRIGPHPAVKAKYPDLPTIEEMACDESEIIRWYCANHEVTKGSGKQVDPVKVRLECVCIDKKRAYAIILKQRLAALRLKVSSGGALSREDQALLSEYEAEVFNYPRELKANGA